MNPLPRSSTSFPAAGLAVVIGARGGLGAAFVDALAADTTFERVVGLGRGSLPALDLLSEDSIEVCARQVAALGVPRLIVNATGILHGAGMEPEKSLRQLDMHAMTTAFAVNAIGPALLMKHFLPLLPRQGKSVFATLSAKVGSIGDNRLGGWYSYRASKAAQNQLLHTAAIELRRRNPDAICVALHPGTVDTALSAPFARTGLQVQAPALAVQRLLEVIDRLGADDSGAFIDYRGERLPW